MFLPMNRVVMHTNIDRMGIFNRNSKRFRFPRPGDHATVNDNVQFLTNFFSTCSYCFLTNVFFRAPKALPKRDIVITSPKGGCEAAHRASKFGVLDLELRFHPQRDFSLRGANTRFLENSLFPCFYLPPNFYFLLSFL